jgi:pimeloyl-ACP methyl ester carboxylesterase
VRATVPAAARSTFVLLSFLIIQGHRIEYEVIRAASPARPWIVFLHEGLGSIALWKDFPARCGRITGCNVLVYSRYGYGQSDPLAEPRVPRYMHDEALKSLPELLDALAIDRPILFGHSDGASIALIHAGGIPAAPSAVIAMAPHVMVERLSLEGIELIKRNYETTDLRTRLARHHADPDSAFRGWSEIWSSAAFLDWNIEEFLPRISCPALAIQGADDEYGSLEHIERMQRAIPRMETLILADCGHSPHRDQPEAVLERVTSFIAEVAA